MESVWAAVTSVEQQAVPATNSPAPVATSTGAYDSVSATIGRTHAPSPLAASSSPTNAIGAPFGDVAGFVAPPRSRSPWNDPATNTRPVGPSATRASGRSCCGLHGLPPPRRRAQTTAPLASSLAAKIDDAPLPPSIGVLPRTAPSVRPTT
jgi:hypothetical protein